MATGGRVTHVRLLVDAYEETFRFYRDVVGLDPTFGDAGSGYADFDTGDVTLALFDAAEMADAIEGDAAAGRGDDDPSLDRDPDAVVVLEVNDVDDTAASFESSGVDLAAPPTDRPEWGIRTVHCRDPDGNLVEFNEPLE